ncbi:MAG TPA: hypothetical protein VN744_06355 [Casimicrobiaceae bacterium]|nr:hypothetical protein [Casimicrobiaceae bacterium]
MTDPVHESIPAGERAYRQGDSGESLPPRYEGPRMLAQALTRLARGDGDFTRDGPRAWALRAEPGAAGARA